MSFRERLEAFIRHVEELETSVDEAGRDGYFHEYKVLKLQSFEHKENETFETTVGKQELHRLKNRYKDILPYEHTRVQFSSLPGVAGSDYYNANYIKGAKGCVAYLASQGPMTRTVDDFWRMAWENETNVIIMASNIYEKNKPKAAIARYWPDLHTEEWYGTVSVKMISEVAPCPEYMVRHLQVSNGTTNRTVYHLHYISWPDHGTPNTIVPLLNMISLAREYQPKQIPPLLVHCSAGCGRTGTICAIDYVWTLLKAGKLADDFSLFEIIQDMRTQRAAIVQTADQYMLVHRAVKVLFERQLELLDSNSYGNVDFRGNPYDENENMTEDSESVVYEDCIPCARPKLAEKPKPVIQGESTDKPQKNVVANLRNKFQVSADAQEENRKSLLGGNKHPPVHRKQSAPDLSKPRVAPKPRLSGSDIVYDTPKPQGLPNVDKTVHSISKSDACPQADRNIHDVPKGQTEDKCIYDVPKPWKTLPSAKLVSKSSKVHDGSDGSMTVQNKLGLRGKLALFENIAKDDTISRSAKVSKGPVLPGEESMIKPKRDPVELEVVTKENKDNLVQTKMVTAVTKDNTVIKNKTAELSPNSEGEKKLSNTINKHFQTKLCESSEITMDNSISHVRTVTKEMPELGDKPKHVTMIKISKDLPEDHISYSDGHGEGTETFPVYSEVIKKPKEYIPHETVLVENNLYAREGDEEEEVEGLVDNVLYSTSSEPTPPPVSAKIWETTPRSSTSDRSDSIGDKRHTYAYPTFPLANSNPVMPETYAGPCDEVFTTNDLYAEPYDSFGKQNPNIRTKRQPRGQYCEVFDHMTNNPLSLPRGSPPQKPPRKQSKTRLSVTREQAYETVLIGTPSNNFGEEDGSTLNNNEDSGSLRSMSSQGSSQGSWTPSGSNDSLRGPPNWHAASSTSPRTINYPVIFKGQDISFGKRVAKPKGPRQMSLDSCSNL